jgi:alpha-beta hydrolase superfamily lysophospholipase
MIGLSATLTTRDGVALHLQAWPTQGGLKGTVLIVHGLGEHIGRYAHVAARLNAWGWSAVGYDQRGHGRSSGARGQLPHADALLQDLAMVIDAVRAAQTLPMAPLVLLGHSMGGLVAARFVAGGVGTAEAEAWHRPVDALVLSSPALDAGMSGLQHLLLAVLGRLAPNLAVNNGLKPQWISRDSGVVQAYTADPLVHDRVAPRLVQFIVDGGRVVCERAAQWTVPTLLLFAGADRCVAPAGSKAFAAAASPSLVTSREFPALFHEIFNEPEQGQVFDALGQWLAGRASATC